MYLTPRKINLFLLFNLPSAYLCGVRVKIIDQVNCTVSVRHKWINKNPFKSMFWAVQGMAAELSTGALLMAKIKASNKRVSMLVANNKATFTKKATGKITFSCKDGKLIEEALEKAIKKKEGVTFWTRAVGKNEQDIEVSQFEFEWTIKLKS